MSTFEELRSPRALVAYRQHRADCGVGDIACVVLADGFILDCGHDGLSKYRAEELARVINAADPEAFSKHSLTERMRGR